MLNFVFCKNTIKITHCLDAVFLFIIVHVTWLIIPYFITSGKDPLKFKKQSHISFSSRHPYSFFHPFHTCISFPNFTSKTVNWVTSLSLKWHNFNICKHIKAFPRKHYNSDMMYTHINYLYIYECLYVCKYLRAYVCMYVCTDCMYVCL